MLASCFAEEVAIDCDGSAIGILVSLLRNAGDAKALGIHGRGAEGIKGCVKRHLQINAPVLLDCEDKEAMRDDLKTVLPIIEGLAKEFADVYIPLNEHFDEALKTQPEPKYYSADGVHPNANGSAFIGRIYAEALKPIL